MTRCELLGRLFQTLTKWILGLTLPLGCVIIVFARELMRIFGPEFEAGWPILVIGTVGQLINCGVGSVGYLLLMSGQQRRLIRIQAVMAVVMVGLSLLLIPKLGLTGLRSGAAVTNAVQQCMVPPRRFGANSDCFHIAAVISAAAPLRGQSVRAAAPAVRTGGKLAAVDDAGNRSRVGVPGFHPDRTGGRFGR